MLLLSIDHNNFHHILRQFFIFWGVVKMFNKNYRHKSLVYVSEHFETQNLTQKPNSKIHQKDNEIIELL